MSRACSPMPDTMMLSLIVHRAFYWVLPSTPLLSFLCQPWSLSQLILASTLQPFRCSLITSVHPKLRRWSLVSPSAFLLKRPQFQDQSLVLHSLLTPGESQGATPYPSRTFLGYIHWLALSARSRVHSAHSGILDSHVSTSNTQALLCSGFTSLPSSPLCPFHPVILTRGCMTPQGGLSATSLG